MPDGARRTQVLAVLRDAAAPLDVAEIARQVGIHPNTTRFHLDALVDEGVVDRVPGTPSGRGRPPMTYAMRPVMARGGLRDYRLLSEILLSWLADTTPAAAEAVRIGRSWGRHLIERPRPGSRLTAADGVRRLVGLLDELGFAPEAAPDGVRLRHCPFLELADSHRDLVCPIHLGLMQGALAELGVPVTATRLDPFAEGNACMAHLGTRKRRATS